MQSLMYVCVIGEVNYESEGHAWTSLLFTYHKCIHMSHVLVNGGTDW